MRTKTLAKHLDLFDQKERLVLCHVLNSTTPKVMDTEVHLGLLPFIKVEAAYEALLAFTGTKGGIIVRLTNRVKDLFDLGDIAQWDMALVDYKVLKRFGAHPERGHIIQYAAKKRVTVGMKWSLPKKTYIPDDDVLVAPHVTLKKVGKVQWRIRCEARYAEMVENYLVDHCV
jgi:hypothetical protein